MRAEGLCLSSDQSNTPEPVAANQFAFESPDTNETHEVAGDNTNDANYQVDWGKSPDTLERFKGLKILLDVPTGAAPSPLFGAQPFSQQMLRFEEFGPVTLGPEGDVVAGDSFPAPHDAERGPDAEALDAFLEQYITPTKALPSPFPTRLANDPDNGAHSLGDSHPAETHENPWKDEIEDFLGRDLVTPPAEGRPPGEDWAHQRWEEFFPKVYFNTAQADARANSGFRG